MKSEMTQQKLKSSKAAMDVKNIIPFFEMFLAEPSYSVQDAMQLLGDKQDIVGGDRIILKPKSREVDWVQLELLKQPEKPFLAAISVDFASRDALRASFAELTAKYGEPRNLPLPPPMLEPGGRYKPNYSYQFNAKGKRLDGCLVVTVDGVRHGDVNRVISVIYRRFPR